MLGSLKSVKHVGFTLPFFLVLATVLQTFCPTSSSAKVFVYAGSKKKGPKPELFTLAFGPNGFPPLRLVPTEISDTSIPLRKEGYVYLPVASVPSAWLGLHAKNAILIRTSVDSETNVFRIDALLKDKKYYELKSGRLKILSGNYLDAAFISDRINLFSVIDWNGRRSLYFHVSYGPFKGEPKLLDLKGAQLIRTLPRPDGKGFFILAYNEELKKLVLYSLQIKRVRKFRRESEYDLSYDILKYKGIDLRDAQTGIIENYPGTQAVFRIFLIEAIFGRQQISFLDTFVPEAPRIATYQMPTQKWDSNVPLILYGAETTREPEQRLKILTQSKPALPKAYGMEPQKFERPQASLAPEVPLLSELPPPPCDDIVKE